jgi:hypothetical protein
MKMLRVLFILSLFACLLIACEGTVEPEEVPPLEPGDALGEMVIVTASSPFPHITKFCEDEALSKGDCKLPADLGHVWILNGWEADTAEALEAAWAESSWELVVDGRQVDLPAFGQYWADDEDPTSRAWNVALRHPTKGEHIVKWTYDIAGEHTEDVWNFTVTDELSINE